MSPTPVSKPVSEVAQLETVVQLQQAEINAQQLEIESLKKHTGFFAALIVHFAETAYPRSTGECREMQ